FLSHDGPFSDAPRGRSCPTARVRLRPKRDTTLSRRARAHIPRKYEMGPSRPTAPAHHRLAGRPHRRVAGPALPLCRWTRPAASCVSVDCDGTRLPWRSVATGPRFTGKDTSMGQLAWQIIGVGAPIAAAFVARKTLTLPW